VYKRQLHGGDVAVDSEPGGETVFTIGLPKLT
jgi:signal transduction histidine kinase